MPNPIVPNHLREIREAEGLSQRELAVIAGMTDQAISDMENLKYRPRGKTKGKIVNALNKHCRDQGRSARYRSEDVFPAS